MSLFNCYETLKTQIVMKLKKPKLGWNSKTQKSDQSQKLKLWLDSKFKLGWNPKTQFWWNSKTQIVIKLKTSNCDKTQRVKYWWNLKTQIVMKLNHSNCAETQKFNCDETQN